MNFYSKKRRFVESFNSTTDMYIKWLIVVSITDSDRDRILRLREAVWSAVFASHKNGLDFSNTDCTVDGQILCAVSRYIGVLQFQTNKWNHFFRNRIRNSINMKQCNAAFYRMITVVQYATYMIMGKSWGDKATFS